MADQTRDNDAGSGADVVSLAETARDFRFPVLREIEAYWNDLRGTRLLPARSEIDPRRIENALEYAVILERIAPGMARFRLAGMHLNDLIGMEVRGMPLTSFFAPEARKELSDVLEQMFDSPAIARLSLNAEGGIGRPALEGRLLLLPLKSDFGDVSRALGCLTTVGALGRAPRRFSITAQEVTPIAGPEHQGDRRIHGWSSRSRQRPAPAERAFAEASAPYAAGPGGGEQGSAPRPARTEGRPHLYLVKTDE